jgi:hypothetical protein
MSTEPMFTATLYGSAEAAREAEVKWLRELASAMAMDAEIGKRWRQDSSLAAWFPLCSAELARLRAECEAIRAALDRAETSYSGILRADEKRGSGMTEYTRGWGGCLRAINAARAAREGA